MGLKLLFLLPVLKSLLKIRAHPLGGKLFNCHEQPIASKVG